jgi:hypothetical protein
MSGSIIQLNTDVHQDAQELLPWFVLGTLNDAETALVEEHLRTCSQCQSDLEFQRKLQAVPLAPRVELDVNAAFAKLKPQLAAVKQEQKIPRFEDRLEALRQKARLWWMPWVIGAQTVALACLCIVVMQAQSNAPVPTGPYKVLGPGGSNGNIVVMFKPQTAEAEVRRILRSADARVVDGPTVAGAYVLQVSVEERADALAGLRRDPAVSMAESLDAGVVK